VAKVLATVSGTALKPGVSLNRRYYSPEAIADAVRKAQPRLAGGGMPLGLLEPLTQRTHHAAEDDSTRIVGRVRSLTLAEDGSARFTADIADTPHGRTIASLLDTTGGTEPFLRGVSIRGFWEGRVRKVKGPDGADAEQGDSLTLAGLDYTASPGVPGAAVDTFAWAKDGAAETTERVAIYESVQEARVSITEETAPLEGRVLAREMLGLNRYAWEDGACEALEAVPLSKRGSGTTDGSGRSYADPGYQDDKKQRYDLTTKAGAKAAWTYISQKANAAKYTPAQLKRVRMRIMTALKRFGVTVSAESGWLLDSPSQVSEALAEYYGDPSCAGSWSVSASNGPVNLCLSSYRCDPADLDVILRAAADAACKALAALDPDMDGDIDLRGAPGSDTDHDGGESWPEDDELAELDAALEARRLELAGLEEAIGEAAKKAPAPHGVTQAVKDKFLADVKHDTPVDIAAGMRRLAQWAASGHYPRGTSYADLKWFYDQCAAELKRRDPKSKAGGSFPPRKG
jgi:hypothetical protein